MTMRVIEELEIIYVDQQEGKRGRQVESGVEILQQPTMVEETGERVTFGLPGGFRVQSSVVNSKTCLVGDGGAEVDRLNANKYRMVPIHLQDANRRIVHDEWHQEDCVARPTVFRCECFTLDTIEISHIRPARVEHPFDHGVVAEYIALSVRTAIDVSGHIIAGDRVECVKMAIHMAEAGRRGAQCGNEAGSQNLQDVI